MQQKADAKRREQSFSLGDKVLVRLQPYRQMYVAHRVSHKLAKRFYGPFTVLERVGTVAYKIDLPSTSRIHPVFHVSNLKPFKGIDCSAVLQLPNEFFHNKHVSFPVVVCATRTILRHHKPEHQILVQWYDAPLENATWKPFQEFYKTYPNYHLEDKVVF